MPATASFCMRYATPFVLYIGLILFIDQSVCVMCSHVINSMHNAQSVFSNALRTTLARQHCQVATSLYNLYEINSQVVRI